MKDHPKIQNLENSSSKISSIFKFWEGKTSSKLRKSPANDPIQNCVQPTSEENVPPTFVDNQRLSM